MSIWEKYKKTFEVSNLEDIYTNHIILSGATGIDRINHEVFFKDKKKQIQIISNKAISGKYIFTKYKLKLISKGRNKPPREISIPTIRDRITLRGLCNYLNIIFEEQISFDLPQNIISNVKKSVYGKKFTGFIKLDVENFYPSINHSILLDIISSNINKQEIINLIESSITTPTIEKPGEEIKKNDTGVPQGLSISNVLAAIYLSNIDKKLSDRDFDYFRYVDDILVLCDYSKAEDISKEIIGEFKKLELTIHDPMGESDKSTIGKLSNDDFTYLGYNFLPKEVTVRPASLDRLRDSLTSIFTAHKYSKKKDNDFLLWRLNLRITGCIFENKRKGWLFSSQRSLI